MAETKNMCSVLFTSEILCLLPVQISYHRDKLILLY